MGSMCMPSVGVAVNRVPKSFGLGGSFPSRASEAFTLSVCAAMARINRASSLASSWGAPVPGSLSAVRADWVKQAIKARIIARTMGYRVLFMVRKSTGATRGLPLWPPFRWGPIIDHLAAVQTVEQSLDENPKRGSRMAYAAILPGLFVLVLWSVFLLDRGLDLGLHRFGILPRTAEGLWGILFSPFLHGDVEHLFNNSLPALVLGWALMYFYPRIAGKVLIASWLISGLWVWISARGNYHIGASGVVYGLASFLFVSGVIRRQRTLMALSLLVVFLYGGLVWGLFPILPRVSWESHFWGAVAGTLMAYVYRNVPPAVQDPVPVDPFADEDDEDDGDPERFTHDTLMSRRPLRIVYHMAPPHSMEKDREEEGKKNDGDQGSAGTDADGPEPPP